MSYKAILSSVNSCAGFIGRVVFSSSGDPNRTQRALWAAAESLFAVLFPSDCRICQSSLTRISALPVCDACLEGITPLSGILCSVCGEKLVSKFTDTGEGPRCGMCRRVAPPFERAMAYGAYDGILRDLIHLLKYQRVRPVASLLGRLLNEVWTDMPLMQPLVVIPVPLFQRKLRERGFNQATEIAQGFVRQHRCESIQLDKSSLVRTRETASQTGLTRHQRRANMRGAFAVTRPDRIAGSKVLIVDDVMTTGTTVSECARVLSRAGAKQVFVATVARATREADLHLTQPEQAHAIHA